MGVKAWTPTTRPVIVAAANRFNEGTLLIGVRHWDTLMRDQYKAKFGPHYMKRGLVYRLIRWLQNRPEPPHGRGLESQGFIDQFGRWYSREDAMLLARSNNQIIVSDRQMLSQTALHSEDLW